MVATIRNLTSSSATVKYFRYEAGYYIGSKGDAGALRAKREEHREASAWHGCGAEALGLKPGARVSSRAFERLLQGHVPGTEIRLGRVRHGGYERRPGFDLTFSAPKSVSLAALLPTERHPRGDRSVVRAHDEAVRATLDWVEETLLETRGWDPETRQRPRVKAPFMAAALFRHVASRNLDPQLHTHAVIANVTQDPMGRWRSVDPIALHRNARLIGAYYRDRLARNLIARGYSIVPAMAGRIPSFDIAGLGRELCDAFSTRRRELLAYVEDRGWNGSEAQRQIATLATRGRKAEPLQAMLRTLWRERAETLGFGAISVSRSREGVSLPPAPSALEIVGRTVSRLEERYPVFAERELEALALGHSPGRHSLGEIREAVAWMVRDGHLVEAELRGSDRSYVTDRTLKAERRVIAAMKAGLGAGEALAGADEVAAHLAGAGLTAGQEEAVRTVLLSRDRIVGVQGWAGTGKTTMLRHVWELAGDRPVLGLAPEARAARVLERESGMNVRTLQWFLTRCGSALGDDRAEDRLKRMFGGSVVVLDEASLVSTDRMGSLMRIADRLGVARLVLVGDTGQLRAVEAGQPFLQLQRAGMTTVQMDEVRRQRNPVLRAAVLASRSGEPGKAVELLGSSMHEVAFDELGEEAARIWLALAPEARDRTLLLAPTHAHRAEINGTIRAELADEGGPAGQGAHDRAPGEPRHDAGREGRRAELPGRRRSHVPPGHGQLPGEEGRGADGDGDRGRPGVAAPSRRRAAPYQAGGTGALRSGRLRDAPDRDPGRGPHPLDPQRPRPRAGQRRAGGGGGDRPGPGAARSGGRAEGVAAGRGPAAPAYRLCLELDGSRRAGEHGGRGDRGSRYEPACADRPVDVLRRDQPGAGPGGRADRQPG